MPGIDGTGPFGQGTLTGRGLGRCGMGIRSGFGRGLGLRRQVVLTQDEEKKILEAELEAIKEEKESVEKRLKELK